jgi:type IV pilus assembly protein PilC
MAKHPKTFNNLYVSMVQAGEIGGSIDVVLRNVASQLERQVELNRRIRGAMTYPIVVVSVIGIIFVAMMILIVPTFKKLFASLGGTLPGPTKLLISVSNTLASYKSIFVIMGVVGLIFAFRYWVKTEKGRYTFDKMKMKPPIFGPLSHKAAIARFCSTLSSLLSSGVPAMESLDIVANASGNVIVAEAAMQTKAGVREGKPFAEPMKENGIFPPLVIQMVEVGEQTGALDEMLDRVAAFYMDEVNQTVDNLASILEPLLIVTMGVVVGTVIICLYLPMFDYIKLIH